jgi:hypothetical protein
MSAVAKKPDTRTWETPHPSLPRLKLVSSSEPSAKPGGKWKLQLAALVFDVEVRVRPTPSPLMSPSDASLGLAERKIWKASWKTGIEGHQGALKPRNICRSKPPQRNTTCGASCMTRLYPYNVVEFFFSLHRLPSVSETACQTTATMFLDHPIMQPMHSPQSRCAWVKKSRLLVVPSKGTHKSLKVVADK